MSLTDDDKLWIDERLRSLASQLGGRFERIDQRFDQIDQRFEAIDQRFETMETHFAERLERVETTLLTEFHKWASPFEIRQRSHSAAIRALDMEVESLKDRVTKLEQK